MSMTSMLFVSVCSIKFPTGGLENQIYSKCVNALNKCNPCDDLIYLVNKIISFFLKSYHMR